MLEQRLDELQQQVFLQQQQQHLYQQQQQQQQRPWARSPWEAVIDRQSPNISLLLNALTANYDKRLRPHYKGMLSVTRVWSCMYVCFVYMVGMATVQADQ
jgi:hypothetical protein